MRGGAACLLACAPLACALLACTSPAPAPPPAAPDAALSPERQRFEAWKGEAAPADPRAAFAREAEAEAERRRREALARGGRTSSAVEREMREDQLAQLATGDGGCFDEEPDLAGQDDWIRHRALTRGDFLAPAPSPDAKPVVWIPFGEIGAHVAVRLACVVKGRLSEPEPGRFRVEIERVRYLALLSRRGSWWNPAAPGSEEWILRHEQLHFDVAELIAQELTEKTPALHEKLVGHGPDPTAAMADFEQRWRAHLAEQQQRFLEIEQRYDRETRHGNDHARQTEWFARVKRGLAAVRAGSDAAPVLVR